MEADMDMGNEIGKGKHVIKRVIKDATFVSLNPSIKDYAAALREARDHCEYIAQTKGGTCDGCELIDACIGNTDLITAFTDESAIWKLMAWYNRKHGYDQFHGFVRITVPESKIESFVEECMENHELSESARSIIDAIVSSYGLCDARMCANGREDNA